MYILHLETSTKICSAAISRGKEILAFVDLKEGMNHTAQLAPAIEKLMMSNSVRPTDLSAISVSSGPGSYTGLRVGASTAKAMAYSLRLPILSVPSLYALAVAAFKNHSGADLAMPMLDARRNEVYTALFDRDLKEVIPVSSMILEENALAKFIPSDRIAILCGDGCWKIDREGSGENIMIDLSIHSSAVHLVDPAYELFLGQVFSDAMHFVPFYLKPPNITQPRI